MRKFLVLFIAVIFSLVFIACDTPASTSTQNDDENSTITPTDNDTTDDDTTQEPADTSSSDDTDDDEITAGLDTTLEIPSLPESTGPLSGSFTWLEFDDDEKQCVATFKTDYTVNVSGPNRFGEENSDFKYAYNGTYLYTLQDKIEGKNYEECVAAFIYTYKNYLKLFTDAFPNIKTEDAAGLYIKENTDMFFDLDLPSTATNKEIFRACCDAYNRERLTDFKDKFSTIKKFKIEEKDFGYTLQRCYEVNYAFGDFNTSNLNNDPTNLNSSSTDIAASMNLHSDRSHIHIYFNNMSTKFSGVFSGGLTNNSGTFTATAEKDSSKTITFTYSRSLDDNEMLTYIITFEDDESSETTLTLKPGIHNLIKK